MPYFALIIMFYHVKIACYHQGKKLGAQSNKLSLARSRHMGLKVGKSSLLGALSFFDASSPSSSSSCFFAASLFVC